MVSFRARGLIFGVRRYFCTWWTTSNLSPPILPPFRLKFANQISSAKRARYAISKTPPFFTLAQKLPNLRPVLDFVASRGNNDHVLFFTQTLYNVVINLWRSGKWKLSFTKYPNIHFTMRVYKMVYIHLPKNVYTSGGQLKRDGINVSFGVRATNETMKTNTVPLKSTIKLLPKMKKIFSKFSKFVGF